MALTGNAAVMHRLTINIKSVIAPNIFIIILFTSILPGYKIFLTTMMMIAAPTTIPATVKRMMNNQLEVCSSFVCDTVDV
jgi:hypothetical protein